MVFKKIIFQNRYVALETPSRPPPFMANTILNFHFDYRHTFLSLNLNMPQFVLFQMCWEANHSPPQLSLLFMVAHFKHVINIFSLPLQLMSTAILNNIQVHHQHWKESMPPIILSDIRVRWNTICLIVWRSAHQRYIHPSEYSILGENALQNWTNFSS